jgi:hypothetical protein
MSDGSTDSNLLRPFDHPIIIIAAADIDTNNLV